MQTLASNSGTFSGKYAVRTALESGFGREGPSVSPESREVASGRAEPAAITATARRFARFSP
jgi:hypothetical protein